MTELHQHPVALREINVGGRVKEVVASVVDCDRVAGVERPVAEHAEVCAAHRHVLLRRADKHLVVVFRLRIVLHRGLDGVPTAAVFQRPGLDAAETDGGRDGGLGLRMELRIVHLQSIGPARLAQHIARRIEIRRGVTAVVDACENHFLRTVRDRHPGPLQHVAVQRIDTVLRGGDGDGGRQLYDRGPAVLYPALYDELRGRLLNLRAVAGGEQKGNGEQKKRQSVHDQNLM